MIDSFVQVSLVRSLVGSFCKFRSFVWFVLFSLVCKFRLSGSFVGFVCLVSSVGLFVWFRWFVD